MAAAPAKEVTTKQVAAVRFGFYSEDEVRARATRAPPSARRLRSYDANSECLRLPPCLCALVSVSSPSITLSKVTPCACRSGSSAW